jgi:hypothetical protein
MLNTSDTRHVRYKTRFVGPWRCLLNEVHCTVNCNIYGLLKEFIIKETDTLILTGFQYLYYISYI